jgi:hypothetical protein
MIHHGISKVDIHGHLFISAISRRDARLASVKGGELTAGKLGAALEQSIVRRKADAVFLDPFIKTHSVGENDNSAIDFVVEILSDIAIKDDCGLCAPHHTRKGPADPGNADIGRGAGSLKDAFRLCYTLSPMAKDEADTFGVSAEDRLSLIRLDSGKVNLVRRSANARWFKVVSVPIGNATELYPSGDEIQTVECWQPTDLFAGISTLTLNQILTEIDQGLPNGKFYSDHSKATNRAAWHVVTKHLDRTEQQARQMIKTWVKNRVLCYETYHDEDERKDKQGLRVQPAKRPGPVST